MPFLDEISDEARRIGSVNTITRTTTGGLRGDNTDYFGFSYMIRKGGIEIKDKNVIILGTGGASLTAFTVCSDLGAKSVTFVSRTGEVNYSNVYSVCADTEVIINCTPVGMYPSNGQSPIELSRFKSLCGVIDVIYNPSKTKLLYDAQQLGIPSINGLYMLVAQAKVASDLFLGHKPCQNTNDIDRVYAQMRRNGENIVLVGMPGSGKSTVGKLLAALLDRDFVDTDELFVKRVGMSIPEYFSQYGEEKFRALESEICAEVGCLGGKVIATGGGVVTQARNRYPLRQNSTVVFIRRDIDILPTDGRPLSQSTDLEQMFEKRLPLYLDFSDIAVYNNTTPESVTDEILACLQKIYSYQR
jgi:shikimate dehydrogenase